MIDYVDNRDSLFVALPMDVNEKAGNFVGSGPIQIRDASQLNKAFQELSRLSGDTSPRL